MTTPNNPESLPVQAETSDQNVKTSDVVVSYPITSVDPGDLKECGFTNAERTYLTTYLPEIARKMADVYLENRFWDDLRFFAESILERIRPSNPQAGISCSLEELVTYTQEEAQKILDSSDSNPWLDQGVNDALGYGYVLPVNYLDTLPEGTVIPNEIRGRHQLGLFIDGTLSKEVLQRLQGILGEARIWRCWPDSDFALVLPVSTYATPMDDPLLAELALAIPLEEAFRSLSDVKRTFIELHEGYLIAQNEQRQFETWWMLPDGRGIDEGLTELPPIVEYQGDLYSYGNVYPSKEEIYPAIRHEIEK